jgi:hypothetical protein
MKEIPLTQGKFAKVDDEDFDALNAYRWHVSSTGYAVRNVPHPTGARRQTLLGMHRSIAGLEFGDSRNIDHIDGDRLNNQRKNLRIATFAENTRNKRRHANNMTGFKGVSWRKDVGKFWARIGKGKKNISLGFFDDAASAHEAYKKAAKDMFGEFASAGD